VLPTGYDVIIEKIYGVPLQKTVAFDPELYYYWNQAGEGNSHQSETNLIKDP
jgi:hypothetical protein